MRKTELAPWIAAAIEPLPPIATPAEVGQALRVSERTVRRLVNAGQIHTIRTREAGAARVLIPRDAVASYLATLEAGTVVPLRVAR